MQKGNTLDLFKATKEDIKNKEISEDNLIADKIASTKWRKCLEIIRDNVSKQVYNTWFEPIKALKTENDKLTLMVPSQFFLEWIEEHYFDLLQKTIKKVIGANAKLQYEIVLDDDNHDDLEKRTMKLPGLKHKPKPKTSQNALPFENSKSVVKDEFPTFLKEHYAFDNFITGDSNQLASSAAQAVSKNPGGTKFNPLVIYGETGLGKTHLVQAIGNEITSKDPSARVLYTNSERFTTEFINAIQNNKISEFVNFYRSVDVLLVDDIQFFAGKEKTQDNFFHTFNALHQAGKQLVLTSDKPLRELSDVDDRLLSRFQWGLTVDIQQPDLEMRMAILQKKSNDEGFDIPSEIIEYLARYSKSNIRELEGNLISLIAKFTMDQKPLTVELAKEVVHGVSGYEPKPLTIDDIKSTVSDYYNISIEKMESRSRKHEIALSRQMSMYIAKQLTSLSLKSIGSHFGGRDHSTVLHSCQAIENYLVTDKSVKNAYETLFKRVKELSR
jgi:chromosomal replication initiator protein